MQIRFNSAITVSKRFSEWVFAITPSIYISRSDVFASEASYYIVARWIVFQFYVQIITKKKQE